MRWLEGEADADAEPQGFNYQLLRLNKVLLCRSNGLWIKCFGRCLSWVEPRSCFSTAVLFKNAITVAGQ